MSVVTTIVYSGNPNFDGLLSGTQWASTNLTFSFPTDSADYNFGYIAGAGAPSDGFAPLNAAEQQAVLAVLNDYAAISNLQFTQITETTTQHANLREAQSAQAGAAMTFAPNPLFNEYPLSADSWYDPGTTTYGQLVQNPVLGGYGFYAFLHEIGIALGMNDDVQGTDLPAAYDSMAYSIESYRSYVGASTTQGLSNATWGYAQSPMIDDIAAIQQMYGANFSAAGTTVVYSWNPTTGEEYINGVGQGVPGGNTVFTTIWDQGATATYNLSNYTSNLNINLQPGSWSTFSTSQLALLGYDSSGNPIYAPGNVANALEYDNNPASLITSVIGGSGHNTIVGNETDLLMRNSNTGAFEIYDIGHNQIMRVAGMGQVGLEWQIAGFGDFSSSPNETDMLMRNSNTGAFEIYDISNNQITRAAGMGQVGLEWQIAGFGDFSGNPNETDMLMRNSNTGAFEIYDISHNQITLATSMGQVGPEWSIAGSQLAQAMAGFAPASSMSTLAPAFDETAQSANPTLTVPANGEMHPIV